MIKENSTCHIQTYKNIKCGLSIIIGCAMNATSNKPYMLYEVQCSYSTNNQTVFTSLMQSEHKRNPPNTYVTKIIRLLCVTKFACLIQGAFQYKTIIIAISNYNTPIAAPLHLHYVKGKYMHMGDKEIRNIFTETRTIHTFCSNT